MHLSYLSPTPPPNSSQIHDRLLIPSSFSFFLFCSPPSSICTAHTLMGVGDWNTLYRPGAMLLRKLAVLALEAGQRPSSQERQHEVEIWRYKPMHWRTSSRYDCKWLWFSRYGCSKIWAKCHENTENATWKWNVGTYTVWSTSFLADRKLWLRG